MPAREDAVAPDAIDVDSIFHLVPARELPGGVTPRRYTPRHLAEDGFVHCAGSPEVALAVASDYFGDLGPDEPLVVLAIDPGRLSAPLRFEAPAPRPGAAPRHLALAASFPHVYGPIDLPAIRGAGVLARDGTGYRWPERFEALDSLLARL